MLVNVVLLNKFDWLISGVIILLKYLMTLDWKTERGSKPDEICIYFLIYFLLYHHLFVCYISSVPMSEQFLLSSDGICMSCNEQPSQAEVIKCFVCKLTLHAICGDGIATKSVMFQPPIDKE